MPGVGTDLEEAYADSVRDRLSTMDKSGVCGWIVDLRSNFGGNMGPMLTGLAPIMGEGAMLQWYHRPSWMTEYLGVSRIRTAWRPERSSGLSSANAPVALIIGKKTTSSGELVVVAFHGRKETKFFGEPTAGKPSGNEGYALRDGSMLLVTTALAVDRNGKIFSEAIQPDELIPLSYEESVDLRADTVVSAAKRWIHSASSCSPAQLIENTSK